MRWAGDVLALLGDNALTRGWNDLATNVVIQPVERGVAELARVVAGGAGGDAMAAQDTRVRLARRMVDDLVASGGKLSNETVEILRSHVDPQFDVARYEGAVPMFDREQVPYEERVLRVAEALNRGEYAPGTETRGDIISARTDALRQAALGGVRAYSHPGELMRQFGNGRPHAAYRAPGPGAVP